MKTEYFIHRIPDNKIVREKIKTMHEAKESLKLIKNGFPFREFGVGERVTGEGNPKLNFNIKTN